MSKQRELTEKDLKKLTKKELIHILARMMPKYLVWNNIQMCRDSQRNGGITCFDCESIERKLKED